MDNSEKIIQMSYSEFEKMSKEIEELKNSEMIK